jgi:dienelactone hydrolase
MTGLGWLVVAALAAPADAASRVKDGPLTVETGDLTLRDESRGRDVELRVVHPEGVGPFPVIVFSHGAGGSREGCSALAHFWATNGYVVICPTHADSVQLRRRNGENAGGLGALIRPDGGDPEALPNRARDVAFVIDSLPALEGKMASLKGHLDHKKIGMAGHSMGALTGQLLDGARAIGLRGSPDLTDLRPLAFLLLSPQGVGGVLGEHSWDHLDRPTLFMTGSEDRGRNGEGPEWRTEPFAHAPAGNKYLIFIQGATHMSLVHPQGAPRLDPAGQVEVWDAVRAASLVFWDAYLKKDERDRERLDSGALEKAWPGRVKFSKK